MDTDCISVALTNYNRTDLLYQCVEQIIDDDRIDEIVIADDHSEMGKFNQVVHHYDGIDKVKIFRNKENINCYRNKKRAVELCTNEWVILFDSDNVLTKSYLDSIFSQLWMTNPDYRSVIFAPEFARPHFDFRAIAGKLIDRTTVAGLINVGNCSTMLNAMNYFVNRNEYLRVWDDGIPAISTADSIYQNYCWLKAGNSIYVVRGLQYDHRVHDGSHYKQYVNPESQRLNNDIINRLKQMK